MKYECPPLLEPNGQEMFDIFGKKTGHWHTDEQMRQYAEQAVAPLLAEIERLKRGEFICKECGLRKNSTTTECGF